MMVKMMIIMIMVIMVIIMIMMVMMMIIMMTINPRLAWDHGHDVPHPAQGDNGYEMNDNNVDSPLLIVLAQHTVTMMMMMMTIGRTTMFSHPPHFPRPAQAA